MAKWQVTCKCEKCGVLIPLFRSICKTYWLGCSGFLSRSPWVLIPLFRSICKTPGNPHRHVCPPAGVLIPLFRSICKTLPRVFCDPIANSKTGFARNRVNPAKSNSFFQILLFLFHKSIYNLKLNISQSHPFLGGFNPKTKSAIFQTPQIQVYSITKQRICYHKKYFFLPQPELQMIPVFASLFHKRERTK